MAGTINGGKKAAQTNKEKYGSDYYKKIGKVGGKNGSKKTTKLNDQPASGERLDTPVDSTN